MTLSPTSASAEVRYEKQDAIAIITLNRPNRRNAINQALISGVIASLKQAAADDAIRAIVVTGAGKGFCAGADLEAFTQGFTPAFGRDYIIKHYKPMMEQFIATRKPIIGAINGVAAGAGAALALACDLRVMAAEATMYYAFINIGLGPDGGASWLLARQVGYSRAFEIAIEGEPIAAEKCYAWGLANKVVPSDQVLVEALKWATKLAAKPTLAVGITKMDLQKSQEAGLLEVIEYEAHQQMQAFSSDDLKEGITAFFEKRRPIFTGK